MIAKNSWGIDPMISSEKAEQMIDDAIRTQITRQNGVRVEFVPIKRDTLETVARKYAEEGHWQTQIHALRCPNGYVLTLQ